MMRVKEQTALLLLTGLLVSGTAEARIGLDTSGYAEYEKFIQSDPPPAAKQRFTKDEWRLHLELTLGGNNHYLFLRPEFYLLSPQSSTEPGYSYQYIPEGEETGEHLRSATPGHEVSLPEAYLNLSFSRLQLRLGNQIFNWGTMDIANPTAFFNPYDERELMFRGADEAKIGVLSASANLNIGSSSTLSLVFVPLPGRTRLPDENSFWAPDLDNYATPVYIRAPDEPEETEAGFGARLGTTLGSTDLSVSGYHGQDNQPTMVPIGTFITSTNQVGIDVRTSHPVVDVAAADFAHSLDQLVLQGAAAFSPNKSMVVSQENIRLEDMTFPYETTGVPWISWAAGFNYFPSFGRLFRRHDGETMIAVEYMETRYEETEISSPMASEFVGGQIQDSFGEGTLNLALSGFFDTGRGSRVLWPRLDYQHASGVSAGAGWINIDGEMRRRNLMGPVFYYLRNKDLVTFNLKYQF